jgi:hypothetical protein
MNDDDEFDTYHARDALGDDAARVAEAIATDFLSFPTLGEAARFGCFNCGDALPAASVCASGNAPRRGAYAMHCEACGMSTYFDLSGFPGDWGPFRLGVPQ